MSTYLSCPHKKNQPRIAVEVCQICRRKRNCKAFSDYQNPKLFEPSRPASSRGTSS